MIEVPHIAVKPLSLPVPGTHWTGPALYDSACLNASEHRANGYGGHLVLIKRRDESPWVILREFEPGPRGGGGSTHRYFMRLADGNKPGCLAHVTPTGTVCCLVARPWEGQP